MKNKNLLFCLMFISLLYGFDGPNSDKGLYSSNMEKRNPPKEAISVCFGKEKDDMCSMYINGKDKKGICKAFPGKEYLVCLPNRMKKMQDNTTENMIFTPLNSDNRRYVD